MGQESENPNFFEQLHDEDYVRIHRMDDFDKKWVYHGRLAMHEQNEAFVGKATGGGYYRVQLMSKVDTGNSFQIKGTRTFKMPGRYIPPTALLGSLENAPTPASPNGAVPEIGTFRGGNATEALNSALVGSVIELLKTMREPQQRQGPSIDWGVVISGIVSLATAMIERKDTQIDPLTLLKEIKDIVGPSAAVAQPASNAIADAVKGLKELMGLKDMVEGKEQPMDPESAMYSAVPKLIEALATRGHSAPAAQPALAPGAAPPELWKRLLLSQKRQLLSAAQRGLEPDFAAEIAIRFMPAEAQGVLNEFLAMPDHVELAMQTIPELRQFPHWTQSFFAEIVKTLTEESDDGSESRQEGSGASS